MNEMSTPPKMKPPLPAGLVAMRQAKRAAYEALDADLRAEADLWQQRLREKPQIRKEKRRARNLNVIGFMVRQWGEGESVAEIADAMGKTGRYIEKMMAEYGLKCGVSVARRWRRFWLKTEHDKALHRLAHDAELSVSEMLERLGAALLSDDALVARRAMKIQRKAPAK